MTIFTFYSAADAPDHSRPLLEEAQKRMGFIPNLYAGLAASPAALQGYFALSAAFAQTKLTAVEQQVVLLTVSFENRCEFCVAAHSMTARMVKADASTVAALREGRPLDNPKLDALSSFARTLVQQRGFVDDSDVMRFLAAGYTRANVLDVILGVSLKTLSNYANHVLETPLNEQLASERWSAPSTALSHRASS